VLEVVTHGSRGDIVDVYSSLPWSLLCEEVGKLKLSVRAGVVIALPKAAAGGIVDGDDKPFTTVLPANCAVPSWTFSRCSTQRRE